MYVVATTKRPVPLRHYVYTGNSKQTSNELFEIVCKKEIDKQKYVLQSFLDVCGTELDWTVQYFVLQEIAVCTNNSPLFT